MRMIRIYQILEWKTRERGKVMCIINLNSHCFHTGSDHSNKGRKSTRLFNNVKKRVAGIEIFVWGDYKTEAVNVGG